MQLNVFDYFTRYGFGDGDNKEAIKGAEKHRKSVVESINKEFEKRGMRGYFAAEQDVGTSHNGLRIIIRREGDARYEWGCRWGWRGGVRVEYEFENRAPTEQEPEILRLRDKKIDEVIHIVQRVWRSRRKRQLFTDVSLY